MEDVHIISVCLLNVETEIQVNDLLNVTYLEVELRSLLKYPRNLPNVASNPIFLYSLLRVDIKGRLYFTSEIIVKLLYITEYKL